MRSCIECCTLLCLTFKKNTIIRTATGIALDGTNDHLVLDFSSTMLVGPMTIEVVGKWIAFNKYSPLFDCGNAGGETATPGPGSSAHLIRVIASSTQSRASLDLERGHVVQVFWGIRSLVSWAPAAAAAVNVECEMSLLLDLGYDFGHHLWLGRASAPRGAVLYINGGLVGSEPRAMQADDLPTDGGATGRFLRCVCLSDTHERHAWVDVPDGDVLLISGDVMALGRHFSLSYALKKLRRFAHWAGALPHSEKVVIGGNHDVVLARIGAAAARAIFASQGVTYLEDSGATLARGNGAGCVLWGSPASTGDSANNAFQHDFARRVAAIPVGCDIVLTHAPLGARAVRAARPRLWVSGHYHDQYGVEWIGSTLCVGASTMGRRYNPTNPPIVVDLPCAAAPPELC